MYTAITPEAMRALERRFMDETGTPGLLLMERAARAIANRLLRMTRPGQGALFLCGPGNNGGDGYAAARLLHRVGRGACVWALFDPGRLLGDAAENYRRCVAAGIPVKLLDSLPDAAPQGTAAVVDALFGTGQDRAPEGLYADAIRWINGCGLPVLAVDMPSGTPECMVNAQVTVTFHRRKLIHLLPAGRAHSGEIAVADIGLPQEDPDGAFTVLEPADARRLLPLRPLDSHKGDAGHVLLLAGSVGMAGAAALSANAALRGGAGLATVCLPAPCMPIVQGLAPCATCAAQEALPAVLAGKSAIAAGPGLGNAAAIVPLLEMLSSAPCPQVWDADALNWLAQHPRRLGSRFLITPHPGEAARLLGAAVSSVVADPVGAAEALHARYGAAVLLKGATTVLLDGTRRGLNIVGTPGMATGGSGDVLTGLTAALLAGGLSPFDAAQAGALLHGLAGRAAATRRGIRSMTAADLLDALCLD